MARRRDQVVEAAIEILGARGARGMTYQAIDAHAGVPPGTTSNHFRDRNRLLAGLVEHLESRDSEDWAMLAGLDAPATADDLCHLLAAFIRHSTGPARTRTIARYALFFEAAAHPELRASLERSRRRFTEVGAQWLEALGSGRPERDGRMMLDLVEGRILHRLAVGEPEGDLAADLRTLLSGLLGR